MRRRQSRKIFLINIDKQTEIYLLFFLDENSFEACECCEMKGKGVGGWGGRTTVKMGGQETNLGLNRGGLMLCSFHQLSPKSCGQDVLWGEMQTRSQVEEHHLRTLKTERKFQKTGLGKIHRIYLEKQRGWAEQQRGESGENRTDPWTLNSWEMGFRSLGFYANRRKGVTRKAAPVSFPRTNELLSYGSDERAFIVFPFFISDLMYGKPLCSVHVSVCMYMWVKVALIDIFILRKNIFDIDKRP